MDSTENKNENWKKEYLALQPSLTQFSGRLEHLVRDLLESNKISYHLIESRTKDPNSFTEKISRPGKSYTDPLHEITDLVGLRIILYYPSDVDAACAILRNQFSIDERNSVDKRTELASDQFGYASVHLICKISDNRRALPEWSPFCNFSFEVQTRTVLQHAWASISHALQYKQEKDVPDQFKRRLNRLAGLLELADAEFLSLKEQRVIASAEAATRIRENDFSINLDLLSIKEYLSESKIIQTICNSAAKQGFIVDGAEEPLQLLAISQFLKLQTIAELDALLTQSSTFSKAFFSDFFRRTRSIISSGDADHWATVLLVAYNHQSIGASDLSSIVLWGEDYSHNVLAAAQTVFPNNRISK